MAEELEVKLSLSEAHQRLAQTWLLAQPAASEGGCKTLVNRYYDTPAGDLNRHKVALRVRQAGNRYIQTLKTQGEFVDGAHRRKEWEWPLMGTELNLGLLSDTPVGQGINLAALTPVFETNFQRQVVMVEDGGTVIEVAVDAGHIIAGDNKRPLHEIEFELKAGDATQLVSWARALAAHVPVFLNLVSKAEQGYFLAGLHEPEALREAGATGLSVTEFLHGLSVAWLKGEALAVAPDSLAAIGKLAAQRGAGEPFRRVSEGLLASEPVPEMADREALGQLQLALATATF